MSRILKFKRYHFDADLNNINVSEWGFIEGGFSSPSSNSLESKSKAKDVQYVGLPDKNGDDIYEKDILINHKGEKGLVVFFEAGFALHCKRKDKTEFMIPLRPGFLFNKTIIGNFYKNPELLNNE